MSDLSTQLYVMSIGLYVLGALFAGASAYGVYRTLRDRWHNGPVSATQGQVTSNALYSETTVHLHLHPVDGHVLIDMSYADRTGQGRSSRRIVPPDGDLLGTIGAMVAEARLR